ncbi:MAG TPA: hypothetical protein VHO50_03425 [Bacteroidales bacterium]|nr:hypothetical protein [Bacteroidales bacterium]
MKNKLYYLGIFSGIVTASGCIIKIMYWPFAGILLTIGLLFLSLVFLPVAIGNIVKLENDRKLKIFYIMTAIVMAINFIGALFKIMHWPGAGVIMMIAIPLPFVVLLPVWVFSNGAVNELNCKNILAVMFFFGYFAAISSILALGVSKSIVEDYSRLAGIIESKAEALKELSEPVQDNKSLLNPINQEADNLYSKINEIRQLIKQQDYQNQSANLKPAVYSDVKPIAVMQYFPALKKTIVKFKSAIKEQYGSDSCVYRYVEEAFTLYSDNDEIPWEELWISNNIAASAIESLNLLEFRVRLIELECNSLLASN